MKQMPNYWKLWKPRLSYKQHTCKNDTKRKIVYDSTRATLINLQYDIIFITRNN